MLFLTKGFIIHRKFNFTIFIYTADCCTKQLKRDLLWGTLLPKNRIVQKCFYPLASVVSCKNNAKQRKIPLDTSF